MWVIEFKRFRIRVEASHAYAHARAIAFFSYIWFNPILQVLKIDGNRDTLCRFDSRHSQIQTLINFERNELVA